MNEPRQREAPLDLAPQDFRALGHRLIDRLADFLASLPSRSLAPNETPAEVRRLLGNASLPEAGSDPGALLDEAAELLLQHSLLTGHPRFWGYIAASPAPIGALADLLAATVNPNVAIWQSSPIASEIETQTVRWLAELVGYPTPCAGLLTSGGSAANFIGLLAARRARLGPMLRDSGLRGTPPLAIYATTQSHTWLHKAADLFGFGLEALRWIDVDAEQRMDPLALERRIEADRGAGVLPLMAVGIAGSVATGVVDPLPALAAVCRKHGLWFHVDGAYGAPVACLPDASAELRGLGEADSLALDPHKWLYSPLEAGCALVRERRHLLDAFSHPANYYSEGSSGEPVHFHELGLQNSRGFRALKVWLALRQAGRSGYVQMIGNDIALARRLHERVRATQDLEAGSRHLSITTFRYRPAHRAAGDADQLNRDLLARLQSGGRAYLSHAIVEGRFWLRACIVNFRTQPADIDALPELVRELGASVERGYSGSGGAP